MFHAASPPGVADHDRLGTTAPVPPQILNSRHPDSTHDEVSPDAAAVLACPDALTVLDICVPPVIDRARALIDAAAPDAAAHLLASVLQMYSPTRTSPHPHLVEAARVYVHAATAGHDRHPDVAQWAYYGYTHGRVLHGSCHPPTLRLGLCYARLLLDRALPHDATRVADQARYGYTRLHGDTAAETIAAGELLAVGLHTIGRCPPAREVIAAAWRTWVTGRKDHDERSMSLLATLGTMAAGCDPAGDWLHHLLRSCPPPPRHPAGRSRTSYLGADPDRHRRVCAYTRHATSRAIRSES